MYVKSSDLANPLAVLVAQSASRYLQSGYKNWGWGQEGQLAAKKKIKKKTPKTIMEADLAWERANNRVRLRIIAYECQRKK